MKPSHAIIFAFAVGAICGAAAIDLLPANTAQAQSTIPPLTAVVVTTCGSGTTYIAGTFAPATINTAGSLCVNQ